MVTRPPGLHHRFLICFALTLCAAVLGRVRAESIALRSNLISDGLITVDGMFGDWNTVEGYPDDAAGDGEPGDQDWQSISIAHDTQNVYLRLIRAEGSTGFSSGVTGDTTGGLGYWIIIDTDRNPATGLRSAGGRTFSVGGEFNFGGALALNRWSTGGAFLGDASFTAATGGRQLEIAVSRATLGNPAVLRFILVGETSGDYHPEQGSTTDYLEYQLRVPDIVPSGEIAVRSNRIMPGTIVVDGQPGDWTGIEPYPADAVGDGAGSQDWEQAWIAHDDTHFYLRYRRAAGSLDFSSQGYWGLFDTDLNAATGLVGFGVRSFAIGAELNTSGSATLNRWAAAGCYNSSSGVVSAASSDGRDLEMAIPRTEFGSRSRFEFILAGENSGDYYPDGGASNAFFTYSLYPAYVPFADADGDGDVDEFDLLGFMSCASGPLEPLDESALQACGRFDRDADHDVDQEDFGHFQVCLSGTNVPAELDCGRTGETEVPDLVEQFVVLPESLRPLPEPLPAGTAPGFALRGTKGWNWDPEQYLAEVPVLARFQINFLMNCYLSIYKVQGGNRWWVPLPDAARIAYEQVIQACQDHGVDFCFCMNPQLSSPDPLDPTSDDDFDLLWPHYAWAQGRGVRWFCIALDDISGVPIVGAQHAALCNRMLDRLRSQDAQAQLIFCPTWYWGNGSEGQAYLQALGADLAPDVYVFWTGDAVVTPRITAVAAQGYKNVVNHRLVLWDNYPVNDGAPTLHLGPVVGREPQLADVLDGYMSNPLYPQSEINRLPLVTIADFAYNPWAYDPMRSIGQTIAHLADTTDQRAVLKDLVEAYPGMALHACGSFSTGFNPVRQRYARIAPRGPEAAAAYVAWIEDIGLRLAEQFPGEFIATRATIAADVIWMRQR